jgi:hypothetical protein
VFGPNGVNLGNAAGIVPGGSCGYHDTFNYNFTLPVNYTVQPHTTLVVPTGTCHSITNSPNNEIYADEEVSYLAHELEETATDPNDDSGWHSSGNTENADLCHGIMGNLLPPGNVDANMTFGGKKWLVQENFIRSTGLCHQGGATALTLAKTAWVTTIGVANDNIFPVITCNSQLAACPIVWTSSNPAIATVPASTTTIPIPVTGVTPGVVTITGCTGKEDDQICITRTDTSVTPFPTPITGPSSVRLNQVCYWYGTPGGGVPPYTWGTWSANTGAQGYSESPDSWTGSISAGSQFAIQVYIWDSHGRASSAVKIVTVSASAPNCNH